MEINHTNCYDLVYNKPEFVYPILILFGDIASSASVESDFHVRRCSHQNCAIGKNKKSEN